MSFELRQYRIFPSKRDEWVKFMEERIMLTLDAFDIDDYGNVANALFGRQ
jgi:hypothetical protein